MIEWIVKAALGPVVSLGEKYIDSQVDREKLRTGLEQAAIEADTSFRTSALSTLAFKIPFFILYASHAIYAATIVLDSYSAWNGALAPLKLPEWYQPMFGWVILGLTGLGPLIVNRRK